MMAAGLGRALARRAVDARGRELARGVAGVHGRGRFDEHDLSALTTGYRLVVHSSRHDVQLAGTERHVPAVQADGQRPPEYEEELIGFRVTVPGELALGLDHADVIVVQHRHRTRRPGLLELRQGGREINRIGHDVSVACREGAHKVALDRPSLEEAAGMGSLIQNICVDCARPYVLATFWSQVLDRPIHPDNEPDDDEVGVVLDNQELLFLKVPEPKVVKNRLHLCLQPQQPRDQEVARLISMGAPMVDDRRADDGSGWAVLADPEGNEFCVLRSAAERAAG